MGCGHEREPILHIYRSIPLSGHSYVYFILFPHRSNLFRSIPDPGMTSRTREEIQIVRGIKNCIDGWGIATKQDINRFERRRGGVRYRRAEDLA